MNRPPYRYASSRKKRNQLARAMKAHPEKYEKSLPEAQSFLDRKINLITGQAMKVAQAMQVKQQGLQGTVQAMNGKIMQMKEAQKGQAAES